MSPLEKLNAAATRLVQESASQHGNLAVRLRETAATIRGAVASIRTALEGDDRKPRNPKFMMIVGDEGALPAVEK
jgi:hypothetical protein